MTKYKYSTIPAQSERVETTGGQFLVPDQPILRGMKEN